MTAASAMQKAAAGLDPSTIQNLICWLKADNGQLFQDSARTTPAIANGDPVGSWSDLSGNGKHFSQATSTKRPTLQKNVLGGYPVLRFDGLDDYLQRTSPIIAGTADFTLFVVGRYTAAVSGTFFAERSTAGGALHCDIDYSSVSGLRLLHRNDAGQLTTLTNPAPAAGTWMILQGRSLALQHRFRRDGGTSTSATASSGVTTPLSSTIGAISIATGITTLLTGEIAEIILYNVNLNNTKLDTVGAYLQAKYNLPWAHAI